MVLTSTYRIANSSFDYTEVRLSHPGVYTEARYCTINPCWLALLSGSKWEAIMEYRMTFTDSEWNTLMNAPEVAAFYISLASPSNMFSIVKEMMASTKQIVDAIQHPTGNALVDEIAADIKTRVDQGVKIESPILAGRPETRGELCLQYFRDLSALLALKAAADAEGYKKWIYKAAVETAEAAKEGGFLGFGGEKVNAAELDALKNLAQVLGVTA
jgi:hypothetical protein